MAKAEEKNRKERQRRLNGRRKQKKKPKDLERGMTAQHLSSGRNLTRKVLDYNAMRYD